MVITTFEFDEYVHDGERRCTSAGPRVAQLIGPPSLLEMLDHYNNPLHINHYTIRKHCLTYHKVQKHLEFYLQPYINCIVDLL